MLHQVAGLFVNASSCTQRWPSTPHLPSPIEPVVITQSVFDDSVMDSSRVVLWLHPSSVGQGLDKVSLNCLRPVRHPLPWHSMATSSITNSLVQNLRRSFHSQAPGTSPVLQLGCELFSLSLCSSTQDHFSRNSHKPMPTTTENDRHCKSQRQGDNMHRTNRCGTCFKKRLRRLAAVFVFFSVLRRRLRGSAFLTQLHTKTRHQCLNVCPLGATSAAQMSGEKSLLLSRQNRHN